MQILRPFLVVVLSACFANPHAMAQQAHVVDQAMLDQAVTNHAQVEEVDRDTIRRLLQRQQVREIAARIGLDVRRAETAVATLQGAELREIAAQARVVDGSLAGGQSTITLSTTTIIIGLLILILIIVAVG